MRVESSILSVFSLFGEERNTMKNCSINRSVFCRLLGAVQISKMNSEASKMIKVP